MNTRSFVMIMSFILSFFLFPITAIYAAESLPIQQVHKINLNKATVAELTGSIKGIGKKRAEAIVAYRDSHHGFKSLDELAEVKGLGSHFVEKNQEKLSQIYSLQ